MKYEVKFWFRASNKQWEHSANIKSAEVTVLFWSPRVDMY